jgi:uncharacterized membrane protein
VQNNETAQAQQLGRLKTLTDVVYALVIWRLFFLLPKPDSPEWDLTTFSEFLGANVMALILIIIGLAFTIIYWLQHNELFSRLKQTDGRHTALSIAQIFLLLLFLYSLKVGITLGASPATRVFESVAAALVGFAAGWAWNYAVKKRRLLRESVSDEEAHAISDRILAEPIAATITIPFAFIGPWFWEAAWLTYPLITRLLKRRRAGKS